jgi:hypothetical protein
MSHQLRRVRSEAVVLTDEYGLRLGERLSWLLCLYLIIGVGVLVAGVFAIEPSFDLQVIRCPFDARSQSNSNPCRRLTGSPFRQARRRAGLLRLPAEEVCGAPSGLLRLRVKRIPRSFPFI